MTEALTPENMAIWNEVCNTPPERTQKFSYTAGGKQYNDVNPAWRIQKLTEVFGPCGQGWGYEVVERWREKYGDADCCYVMLKIWYIMEGERCETGPQIGGTVAGYSPDEVWKMSITDALGKCAMLLGVAADIYLGTFDTKYRDKATNQTAAIAPPQDGTRARTAADFKKNPPQPTAAGSTPF